MHNINILSNLWCMNVDEISVGGIIILSLIALLHIIDCQLIFRKKERYKFHTTYTLEVPIRKRT